MGLVLDAVLGRQVSDPCYERDDHVPVVGNRAGERVQVRGGPTRIVCGEKHSAFDHKLVGVRRSAQSREPALDDVEREEFLRTAAFSPRAVLQVEVSNPGL